MMKMLRFAHIYKFKNGDDELVKIKVSYNTDSELLHIKQILSPYSTHWKISRNSKGNFKKAYAHIKIQKSP